MKTARVIKNGRVTIFASLRKKYKLTPGRKVRLEVSGYGLQIIPLATSEEIKIYPGKLGLKGKMLKSFRDEKKRERKI